MILGRYTRKNRLYDLVSEIGDIREMKNTPLQEKADSLHSINAQINAQDPSIAYNDSQLIADLIESMVLPHPDPPRWPATDHWCTDRQ